MLINNSKNVFMEMVSFNLPPPEPPKQVQQTTDQKPKEDLKFKDFYQSSKPVGDSLLLKKAADYIEKNEDRKHTPYKDIYGKWTVGVGHLMSSEEIKLYVGKTLSDEIIQNMFEKDIASKLKLVRSMFGSVYETYSDNLKTAILDGFFRGDLSGSPETIKLLKAKKFKEASVEYLDNDEYRRSLASKNMRGVAYRMQRNAKVMANEKIVTGDR